MFFRAGKILFFFTVFLSGFSAWAQFEGVIVAFTRDRIETNGTGLSEAHVKIKNTSTKVFDGFFEVHSSHEDIYVSQRNPKPIHLLAGDSIFVPVKIIISTSARAGNKSTVEAALTSGVSKTAITAVLPVIIQERKLVKVFLPETNIIYEKIGDSLSIPVRIQNEGNTPQKIAILARFPNFITRDALESTIVDVKAFTDTIFYLKKQVNAAVLKHDDFEVNVTALYHNGDLISNTLVRASSIRSDRRYIAPYAADTNLLSHQENQVTASVQHNDNSIDAYFLYANAQAQIDEGLVQANLDINWWQRSEQLYIRNTWLGYKQKNYGVTVGNVSKFSDFNMIGRGADAFYKTGAKDMVEAGVIDKSFNLIDDVNVSMGKSAWGGFTHNGGWMQKKGYEAIAIYDTDTYYGIKNYLASSRFALVTKDKFTMRFGGSLSNITAETENTNVTGGAADVQLGGKLGALVFNSLNYYSSGNYAGMRKGVFNFNERLNLSLGKFNLWSSYNMLSVEPDAIGSQYQPAHFKTTRADIGLSKRIKGFTVTVSPYIFKEERKERFINASVPNNYTLDAVRLNLGLNYYNAPTRQNMSLTFEGGNFKTNTFEGNEFHYKVNFIYNWRAINLLAFYQYNNFYLGEIVANYQSGNTEKYTNLTIMPTFQQKFFDERLYVNMGVSYSDNSLVAESLQINGRIEYKLTDNFTIFAYNFYSDFSTSPKPINTIQAGLTKRFNPIKIDRSRSELEIFVYYETGGKQSEGFSKPAAGQLVIIEGKAFRTDDNGFIKYRKLPRGTYSIRPVSNNEWNATEQTIQVEGDTKISIGLTRTATIKGKISYTATDKSFDITRKMTGLSVIAVDSNGKVHTTKTDDSGSFVMYVPKGIYTVTLEKAGVSEYVEIEDNNRQVNAEPSDIEEVPFNLQIKEKRVETRKFSSRGFSGPAPAPAKPDKKKK